MLSHKLVRCKLPACMRFCAKRHSSTVNTSPTKAHPLQSLPLPIRPQILGILGWLVLTKLTFPKTWWNKVVSNYLLKTSVRLQPLLDTLRRLTDRRFFHSKNIRYFAEWCSSNTDWRGVDVTLHHFDCQTLWAFCICPVLPIRCNLPDRRRLWQTLLLRAFSMACQNHSLVPWCVAVTLSSLISEPNERMGHDCDAMYSLNNKMQPSSCQSWGVINIRHATSTVRINSRRYIYIHVHNGPL